MNSYRNFLPLPTMNPGVIFLWLILGATCVLAVETASFRTGLPGIFQRACQAALLLTPEQAATLQASWQSREQEVLRILGSSQKLSPEQQQEISEVEKVFDQKRNEVLTQDQRDIILLINDVSKSVTATVRSDFAQQLDAAFTKEEKAKVGEEISKAIRVAFERELKASLPKDRFAAFQAAQAQNEQ